MQKIRERKILIYCFACRCLDEELQVKISVSYGGNKYKIEDCTAQEKEHYHTGGHEQGCVGDQSPRLNSEMRSHRLKCLNAATPVQEVHLLSYSGLLLI